VNFIKYMLIVLTYKRSLITETMTVSELTPQNSRRPLLLRVLRLPIATLVLLGIIVAVSTIAIKWFMGESRVTQVFSQLHFLQAHPPLWLDVPSVSHEYYLLIPTVALCLICQAIVKISPQPRTASQVLVVALLFALTIRYLLWRSLSTLNFSNPLDGLFSLGLFFMELFVISGHSFQWYLNLKIKPRHREADIMAVAVREGSFIPTVDILIPTYNEPTTILRRTIIGCQALDYPSKNIYLLDDTRRPEMKKMAQELGCEYITRPDNRHAKAGNLNHAIAQTNGELIVVFDADFIPTKNFLNRTVGFFQNQEIGLVQTHQSFYNSDPIARNLGLLARNLGLQHELTPEVEIFSRYYQLLRDGLETALCYGSSFVVRRSALEAVGGFVTDSLSEDYFTGVCLSAQGYRVIYLGERLSAGLSAENMAGYVTQRLRWARGSLQAFFIPENPLTISGLGLLQRLAHLEGLCQWFTSVFRLGFMLMPIASSFLGIIPLRATLVESVYFFLPYYVAQLLTFSWLNNRSRSALVSDIYAVAQCVPVSLAVIQTMLNPFSQGFKVTPKGIRRDRFTFNWTLAWPLILLLIATAVSLWHNLDLALWDSIPISGDPKLAEGRALAWIWSAYNLLIISIALLILLDVPNSDPYEWFNLQRVVRIQVKNESKSSAIANCELPIPFQNSVQNLWGVTTIISEGGMEVALTQDTAPELLEKLPVKIEIMEEKLELTGQITHISSSDQMPRVRVMFEPLNLSQYRHLIEFLFCRPGRWKRQNIPGELQSLGLLFRILLKPKVLFDRKQTVSAIAVSQV
jgi:cellulose synthase (UDP-forming)